MGVLSFIYLFIIVMVFQYLYKVIVAYHKDSQAVLLFQRLSKQWYMRILIGIAGFCIAIGYLFLSIWLADKTEIYFRL